MLILFREFFALLSLTAFSAVALGWMDVLTRFNLQ